MPIAPLSSEASTAISSTLVLNDAISVVKELIDNALDSNATNILVEISANTLDVIQLKDNGAGIGVEDRQLLCKRGYTSKFRTLEDLEQLGGTSLGFRGEALASIANLSGLLTFITRVDGEISGTQLDFDSNGKLRSSSSASHGTGTTVRVTNFLKNIPVRRQTAQKQATKTLSNVKRLLFNYAFARPTVRFQVKVLKSKSDLKDNWLYAPCKDATNLPLLASKIVSKDIVAQCKQESIDSADGQYIIDALLPSNSADVQKLAGIDQYISIDNRPVTSDRGFTKDVNKLYRSYVRTLLSDGGSLPRKVFLLLRVRCPPGAYDVNIEPAKNEVMFTNLGLVLGLFKELCDRVYGELNMNGSLGRASKVKKVQGADQAFDILLAKKVTTSISNERNVVEVESQKSSNSTHSEISTQRPSPDKETQNLPTQGTDYRSGIYNSTHRAVGSGKEERRLVVMSSGSESANEEAIDDEEIMDSSINNPFVLANMNSRIRSQNHLGNDVQLVHNVYQNTDRPRSPQIARPANERYIDLEPPEGAPMSPSISPDRPFQNPGPPNRPWKTRNRDSSEAVEPDSAILSPAPSEPTPRPTLLDSWTKSINSPSLLQPLLTLSDEGDEKQRSTPLSNIALALPGSNIPKNAEHKELLGTNSQRKPFRSPLRKTADIPTSVSKKDETSQIFPSLTSAPRTPFVPSTKVLHIASNVDTNVVEPDAESSKELNDIMDFEHRKRESILRHRTKHVKQGLSDQGQYQLLDSHKGIWFDEVDTNNRYAAKFASATSISDDDSIPPQPRSSSYTQNPHQNRYRKAIRDLEDRSAGVASPKKVYDNTRNREKEDLESVADAGQDNQYHSILSSDDARAYLIRQQRKHGGQGKVIDQKTSRTQRLPFENVRAADSTYQLVCMMPDMSVTNVSSMTRIAALLKNSDPYIVKGLIEPILPNLSSDRTTLVMWESKIRQMLGQREIHSLPSSDHEA